MVSRFLGPTEFKDVFLMDCIISPELLTFSVSCTFSETLGNTILLTNPPASDPAESLWDFEGDKNAFSGIIKSLFPLLLKLKASKLSSRMAFFFSLLLVPRVLFLKFNTILLFDPVSSFSVVCFDSSSASSNGCVDAFFNLLFFFGE